MTDKKNVLNWNARVRVTLTGVGREMYDRHWLEIMGKRPERPVAPQDGVIEMPLWEAAHMFGQHLYNGQTETPMMMEMELL